MSASRRSQAARVAGELLRRWWALPPWPRAGVAAGLVGLLLVGLLILKARQPGGGGGDAVPVPQLSDPGPGTYTFCFWNVENLFDDKDDGRSAAGDSSFDPWMANDAEARRRKLSRLCEVILHADLNGGKGPDILAVCEVESRRAVELLRDALNAEITDPALRYGAIAWAGPGAGRHIGPAVLSRLPLRGERQLGNNLRILETRAVAAGQELVIIASHWTSRLSDKEDDGRRRAGYADAIYGRFRQVYEANAEAALLVCGDFNDDPTDRSVTEHLRAAGDRAAVIGARPPRLYNPFAALFEAGQLTHYHSPKGHVFDQVCLSPGLLGGGGWSYVDGSAAIVPRFATRIAKRDRPNRFGGKGDTRSYGARGASDHFPVVVRLKVSQKD